MLQREGVEKQNSGEFGTYCRTDRQRARARAGPSFLFLSFSVTSQSRNWSGTLYGPLSPRGELSQSRYGNERAAGKEGLSLCLVSARGQPFTSILSLHQKMFRVSSTAVSDIRRPPPTRPRGRRHPHRRLGGLFTLVMGEHFPREKPRNPLPMMIALMWESWLNMSSHTP